MKSQVGLWIDHRAAKIVTLGGDANGTARTEVTEQVLSRVDNHIHFSGDSAEGGVAEDRRDRQVQSHLDRYYDDVIAHLRNADSIFIFGPGEAKGELRKRLAVSSLLDRDVVVETVDELTDHQIAAKVREPFQVQD